MKLYTSLLFLIISISTLYAQEKSESIQKKQRYNIVINANYYFVFVNDSITGEILKDSNVSLIYNRDTIKGERIKLMAPDYPFSFKLFPGRKVTIIVNSIGYRNASYEVTMSPNKKWFECQLIK